MRRTWVSVQFVIIAALAGTALPAGAQDAEQNALLAYNHAFELSVAETAGPRRSVVFESAFGTWKFSPDASSMAVAARPEGQQQMTLSVIPAGGTPKMLTSIPSSEGIMGLDWSADSRRIAYTRVVFTSRGPEDPRLVVIESDEGQPEVVADDPGWQLVGWRPVVGSDEIAYLTQSQQLVLLDTASGARSQLAATGRTGGWSPLGSHVAVAGYIAGVAGDQSPLQIVDVRTRDVRVLAEAAASPAFSPDGRQLAAWVPAASDEDSSGWVDLMLFDVESGASRTLVSRTRTHEGSTVEWTPDGEQVAFVHEPEGASGPLLEFIDVSTLTRTDVPGARLHYFDIAPAFEEAWLTESRTEARSIAGACPEEVPEDGYSDVPASNPHEFAIDCVTWWDVARGTSTTTYSPGATVNRAQMASFFARLIQESGGSLPAPTRDWFSDDNGNAHEHNINRLAEAGIVSGAGDGRYRPGADVSRAQMATFIVNATNWRSDPELTSSHDYFTDDNGNAHEPAINAAAEAGISNGTGDGKYEPAGPVRRDQMASFLARVLDLLVERGDTSPPN